MNDYSWPDLHGKACALEAENGRLRARVVELEDQVTRLMLGGNEESAA